MTGPALWEVVFELSHGDHIEKFETVFDGISVGISSFAIKGTPRWRVTVYSESEPDRSKLHKKLAIAAAAAGTLVPEMVVYPVVEKDWVEVSERCLKPIEVGPYYIAGSHIKDSPPPDSVLVEINAGLAFGTGRHETTISCLEAIEEVYGDQRPQNPLDVGTGSGILAIALAKRYKSPVVASDYDNIAIEVARRNASINNVGSYITFVECDGFDCPQLRAKGPFDLIIANIVANPLIKMAGDIANATSLNGRIILSGILTTQLKDVTMTFEQQGFFLVNQKLKNDWETVVLRRLT